MQFKLRYGQAKLVDDPRLSWRPARVVDDLLGLRREQTYVTHLHFRYGGLCAPKDIDTWPLVGTPPASVAELLGRMDDLKRLLAMMEPETLQREAKDLRENLTAWRTDVLGFVLGVWDVASKDAYWSAAADLRSLFVSAAWRAANGQLDPALAPHLARVERMQGGIVGVPDLPAFAAWCLEETLRKGPPHVEECGSCGNPWLVERGARYCARSAPETIATCRSLDAHKRYVEKHGNFHRQRRRLYDRMKRGTLSTQEYREWLDVNRPGLLGRTWVAWDDWKIGKRPKGE